MMDISNNTNVTVNVNIQETDVLSKLNEIIEMLRKQETTQNAELTLNALDSDSNSWTSEDVEDLIEDLKDDNTNLERLARDYDCTVSQLKRHAALGMRERGESKEAICDYLHVDMATCDTLLNRE